jgi:ankyrin repeat protein
MSDISGDADGGDAVCQFGAVFLRDTIKFVSPVDYIEYCLKVAYVAQRGLNRLQELILCRPTDDRKSRSPSPVFDNTKNPAVLERVSLAFPDVRMRSPDFALGPFDINKDQTPPPNLLDSLDTQNLSHCLFSACYHGQSKTLKHLLSEQQIVSLINECDENGCTALLWAIASQNTTCVSTLIAHKVDVNITDKQGRSCLHWACRLGHIDTVKLILSQEVDVNQADAMGRTPLHMAAESHHSDTITLLLKEEGSNLDLHKKDNDGVTALMLAARHGGSEKVRLLLKEGADPTSVDKYGRSLIHWAAGNPNPKSVQCVVENHKPALHFIDAFQQTALHVAGAEGNLKVLEFLIKKGMSPSVDAIGASPLHWAAFSGHLNCVKYLLGMKFADSLISRADNSGALPIHYAALRGQDNIVTILTDKKNQCGCVDRFGLSPICWAVFGDHGRTVNLMVKSKADVVQQDSNVSATNILAIKPLPLFNVFPG